MPERPRRPRADDVRAAPVNRPADDGEAIVVDTRGRRRASSPARDAAGERREEAPERPRRGAESRQRPPRREAAAQRPVRQGHTQRESALRQSDPSRNGPTRGGRPLAAPRDEEHPRRRRRLWRLVPLVILLWLAFLVITPFHAWNTVSRVDDSPAGTRPAQTPGNTYLLVGSDSRGDLTAAERKELGTGSAEGQRTDSIMLIHVPSGGGKSAIISIPRDSYMPIPGYGSNKVNAAYAIGGPKLLIETLEQTTNLRIDGYLEIGFGGFANVVNSLGGVDLCVPFDMDDTFAHINLKKGCQVLDGKNALGFVRARHSDPRGDIGRTDRQRQFLGAIMKGAATPSTVLNPFRYWSFTHTAAKAVGVGQETSMRDAANILLAMRGASNDSTLSLTVPLKDLGYQTHAGLAVKWDTERARALFTMLREDQPLEAPPAGTDGKPSGN